MARNRSPVRRWDRRCTPGWDTRDAAESRALQDAMLSRFITEQVYPFHPYYHELFDREGIDPRSIRTVADLQRIPFTYKEDIAPHPQDPENPRRFVLDPGLALGRASTARGWTPLPAPGAGGDPQEQSERYQPVFPMFTTGTTAEPTPFFFTLYDLERMKEAGRRLASVTSSRAGEDYDLRVVAVNNFPGSAHLAHWVALTGAEGAAITTFNTGGGPTMGRERVLNIVERVRPTLFMGLPGYTYDLFKTAVSEGRDLSSIEVVAMGGDRVTPMAREKIAGLLEETGAVDPVVTAAFGCTEMKYAWGDCGDWESRGYHTYPDMEIIEVVDPETGAVLAEGETGELVVTNLDARGSVVLRYRTGDVLVGGYSTERCPACGRTVPRISSQTYRRPHARQFNLAKVKGNLVDLNTFVAVLDNNVDVLEWVVEIRNRNDDPADVDEVWVYVCPTSVGEVSGLRERIVEDLRNSLELTPDRVMVTTYEKMADQLVTSGDRMMTRVIDLRLPE
ncbi:MAG: AMP-binding protein [Actinobacteria bacterium]|nr:AMP-binding protein [Actinomycetota bacterium]MBU1942116.1 AMP-binding protein [Actinomycetota bacterium]MBU2686700.1 AMP-binding protein [Actinomycetota bacterium]